MGGEGARHAETREELGAGERERERQGLHELKGQVIEIKFVGGGPGVARSLLGANVSGLLFFFRFFLAFLFFSNRFSSLFVDVPGDGQSVSLFPINARARACSLSLSSLSPARSLLRALSRSLSLSRSFACLRARAPLW